eukprot:9495989-Pyramimonas_sp.AAC.1
MLGWQRGGTCRRQLHISEPRGPRPLDPISGTGSSLRVVTPGRPPEVESAPLPVEAKRAARSLN